VDAKEKLKVRKNTFETEQGACAISSMLPKWPSSAILSGDVSEPWYHCYTFLMHTAGLEAGTHPTKTQYQQLWQKEAKRNNISKYCCTARNEGLVHDVPFRLSHDVIDLTRISQRTIDYCSISVVILCWLRATWWQGHVTAGTCPSSGAVAASQLSV
jgi:hypothetical protein